MYFSFVGTFLLFLEALMPSNSRGKDILTDPTICRNVGDYIVCLFSRCATEGSIKIFYDFVFFLTLFN